MENETQVEPLDQRITAAVDVVFDTAAELGKTVKGAQLRAQRALRVFQSDAELVDVLLGLNASELGDRLQAERKRQVEMIRALDDDALLQFLEVFAEDRASAAQAERGRSRHMETEAMKAEAFRWLWENFHRYRSADAAAREMVKLDPIKFITAQRWIREWKKPLRQRKRLIGTHW